MQGHHPAVDVRGDLVAELDGEGGVAAGQVLLAVTVVLASSHTPSLERMPKV